MIVEGIQLESWRRKGEAGTSILFLYSEMQESKSLSSLVLEILLISILIHYILEIKYTIVVD